MNREMTDLARGLKCGGLGKNGESVTPAEPTHACDPTACAARGVSPPNRYAKATPLMPPPVWNNMSRREMNRCLLLPLHSGCEFMDALFLDDIQSLVNVKELVAVQDDMRQLGQRGQSGWLGLFQELQALL